ncbi:unnamed protein product [Prunus brigantina]
MLMLGISIGVAFNVMFANWMVTVLPIILFLGNNILNTNSLFTLNTPNNLIRYFSEFWQVQQQKL